MTAIVPGRCPVVFVVLSAAFAPTDQGNHALSAIAETASVGGKALLLPVRLDDAAAPEAIQSISALDARASTPEAIAEGVAAKLREWKPSGRSGPRQTPDEELIRSLLTIAEREAQWMRRAYPSVDIEDVIHITMYDLRRLHRERPIAQPQDDAHLQTLVRWTLRRALVMEQRREFAALRRLGPPLNFEVEDPSPPSEGVGRRRPNLACDRAVACVRTGTRKVAILRWSRLSDNYGSRGNLRGRCQAPAVQGTFETARLDRQRGMTTWRIVPAMSPSDD